MGATAVSYSRGPYAAYATLPSPDRPEVHSSREVDFARRRYSFDTTTGAFESMPHVAQRAVILVARNVKPRHFITEQDQEATRQDIVRALEPLASLMADLVVTVERPAAGREEITVRYRDTSTGLNQTVQLT
jgi:hypothetical protein